MSKYCPFQPPITEEPGPLVFDGPVEVWQVWQKCGETCALYSEKLQECVFCTIANRIENIGEQLSDIADSVAVVEERTNG